jgi:hypothetical protein
VLKSELVLWVPSVTMVDGDVSSVVSVVSLVRRDVLVLDVVVVELVLVSRVLSRLESIDETDISVLLFWRRVPPAFFPWSAYRPYH